MPILEISAIKDFITAIQWAYKLLKYASKHVIFALKWILKGIELKVLLKRLVNSDREILKEMPDVQVPINFNDYENITQKHIKKIQSNHGALIWFVNNRVFKKTLLKKIKVENALNIDVSDDLTSMTFNYNGNELQIDGEKLLFPCNCKIPDEYKNQKLPCPLHSRRFGRLIDNAFKFDIVRINFQDVSIFYKDSDVLWPPSIDSLHFAKVLKDNFQKASYLKSIIDIGTGTGFLGISLAKSNESIKKLTFTDIFLTPVFTSLFNAFSNFGERKIQYSSFPSNCFDKMKKTERYDMAICNPPYLPLLEVREIAGLSAVSGTYLLERVICETGLYAKQLVFGASELVQEEIDSSLEKIDKYYRRNDWYILDEYEVPFRVNHAFKTSGYMKKLWDLRGEHLIPNKEHSMPIWHKIKYYHIKYD